MTIRVLVVDDEPALLDLVRRFLEKKGDISVVSASSGSEALQKLSSSEYDAIVCDYMMPGLDGIEVLKTIRSQGIETPLIIFTGHGREDIVIDALNYGAHSYLQKGEDPVLQFSRLRELIIRAIQRRKAEKDLVENLQHYRQIVEDHIDLVYRFTPDGIITFVNGPYGQYVGRNPEELMGKSIFDFFNIEDRKKLEDLMNSMNDSVHTATIDLRVPAAEDQVKWQRLIIHALFSKEGIKNEYQVIGRDITEAKQTEEVMRESEEKLRVLFNPSTDFIRVLNKVRLERPEE